MMKTSKLTIVLLLCLVMIAIGIAQAAEHNAQFVVGQSSYAADGKVHKMDAKTFIENGRTYVPVRYLGYALGVSDKQIGWSAPYATLTMNDITVKLAVGDKQYFVNDQANTMDVEPIIKDGRTYLPARFVAEAFGYKVDWDSSSRTVTIHPPAADEQEGTEAAPGGGGVPVQEPPVQEQPVTSNIKTGPFDPAIKTLDMTINSTVATATDFDGNKRTINLSVAPQLVVNDASERDFILSNIPGVYEKYEMIIDSDVPHVMVYVPFVDAAKAFGVPEENIKWDGKQLRAYINPDLCYIFTPRSLRVKVTKKGWKDGKVQNLPKIINGKFMIAREDLISTLFWVSQPTTLTKGLQNPSESGNDIPNKTASISCLQP